MSNWEDVNSRLRYSYAQNYDLLKEQSKSSKSTFLWFAGISGYIIVNAKELWVDLLGPTFFTANNLNVLIPYVPSVIAVIFSIFAYLKIDDWFFRFSDFNKHFSNTFEYLTLERQNAPLLAALLMLDTESEDEITSLEGKTANYNSEDKKVFMDLITRKRTSMRSLRGMNRVAVCGVWAFFVSFAWAVLGPLIFFVGM